MGAVVHSTAEQRETLERLRAAEAGLERDVTLAREAAAEALAAARREAEAAAEEARREGEREAARVRAEADEELDRARAQAGAALRAEADALRRRAARNRARAVAWLLEVVTAGGAGGAEAEAAREPPRALAAPG